MHCKQPVPLSSSRSRLEGVQPPILIPIDALACINLSDSNAAMREVVMHMHMRGDYCLVFEARADRVPLGYVYKRQLIVELLTGNRPDIRRLVAVAPKITSSLPAEQAVKVLASTSVGLLCDADGAIIGLLTR